MTDEIASVCGDGETCVICFQSLGSEDVKCRLRCGHCEWHDTCVRRWLLERGTCPVCRAENSVETVFEGMENFEDEGQDMHELYDIVSSLGADMDSWGPKLRAIRSGFERRVSQLDDEHEYLEEYIHRLEEDLSHDDDLSELHTHSSACSSTLQPINIISVSSESERVRSFAEEMVLRLRGAVLRSHAPMLVFRTLAPSGRLNPNDLACIVRQLNSNTTDEEVAAMFEIMDVAKDGFLDQAAWIHTMGADSCGQSSEETIVLEVVERVASALQRASTSPRSLFFSLGQGSPLGYNEIQRLLRSFNVLDISASRALEVLDSSGKGYLEEEEFVEILARLMWPSDQDVTRTDSR